MDIYSLLDSVPATLSSSAIHYLMDYGQIKKFEIGEIVFNEGDESQRVYIILDGDADVIKSDTFGNSNIIATAPKGAVFGEMGVFLNLHHSATIKAKTPLSALMLRNEDFISALGNFPDLSLRLFKSLSMRLNNVNIQLANLINATTMARMGAYILENAASLDPKKKSAYDFSEISKETLLERQDIVNALTNFYRIGIIGKLQVKEQDSASFKVDIPLLKRYLKQIPLSPTE